MPFLNKSLLFCFVLSSILRQNQYLLMCFSGAVLVTIVIFSLHCFYFCKSLLYMNKDLSRLSFFFYAVRECMYHTERIRMVLLPLFFKSSFCHFVKSFFLFVCLVFFFNIPVLSKTSWLFPRLLFHMTFLFISQGSVLLD